MDPIFVDRSDELIARLKREKLMPLADTIARMARNEIVEQMDPGPPRTGRTYRIPGTGRTYVASAPGQPPAVREGIYRERWQTLPAVDDGETIRAFVVNDARAENGEPLGKLLEFGTIHMRPRPHIQPAKLLLVPKIKALIARVLGRSAA